MLVVRIREFVRSIVLRMRHALLVCVYHMDISPSALISFGASLDKTYPQGVHVGDETYVASGANIMAHDFCRSLHTDTRIGQRCFIGAGSRIMPGVVLGDSTIVGADAVVTRSFPTGRVILAGNPAKVIRENIRTGKYGVLIIEKK